jgi:hypothetical protein
MTTEEVGAGVAPRLIIAMVSLGAASICTLRINYSPVPAVFIVLTGFLFVAGLAGFTGTARILIEEIQMQDLVLGYAELDAIGIEVQEDKSWKYDPDNLF